MDEKISFCTVCMNRAAHIKETLIKNLEDNSNYENLEFVLLNYNSNDDLDDFIENKCRGYIESGRLVYYKTQTPQYFHRSHSRNVAFNLASGDIICNIDADNFTGKDFANYIHLLMKDDHNVFCSSFGGDNIKDVLGRVCVRKQHFLSTRGFDEKMACYGFEDADFINRLASIGYIKKTISNKNFLKALSHPNTHRMEKEKLRLNLSILLINYLTPASSEVIFLFSDQTYSYGTIIDNRIKHLFYENDITFSDDYEFSLLEGKWAEGTFHAVDDCIKFSDDRLWVLKKTSSSSIFHRIQDNSNFYEIKGLDLIEEAVLFYSQLYNRTIMIDNKTGLQCINPLGFGKDIVVKNFDFDTLISI